MIDLRDLGYDSTEIPYGLTGEDLELALMIRNTYKVRDLVKVWFDEDDGQQYAVKGGIYFMGLQHLYIKGLTTDNYVTEKIIPMNQIVDIQPEEDQISPYDVEFQIELAASRQQEYVLGSLRAAKEEDNAEDSEGRAAAVRAIQGTIWDAGEWPVGEDSGAIEAQAAEEDSESGYPVTCGRCSAPFMNLVAYWNHLDDHDMATMNSGKYDH